MGAISTTTKTTQLQEATRGTFENYTAGLYADMASVLSGEHRALQPSFGTRQDGTKLFYPGTVNGLVGDSEAGKTFLALSVLAEQLLLGQGALVVDVDYNGAVSVADKLRRFGVSKEVLLDPSKFRYAAPDNHEDLLKVVTEAKLWKPSAAIVDSVGGIMSLLNKSSQDADQYRQVHREIFAALTEGETGVILIDHLAKSQGSREYGATGTVAKKNDIDGALYRVTNLTPFVKGEGGKSVLKILKDRHGTVRELSSQHGKEPEAATFQLIEYEDAMSWYFYPPTDSDNLQAKKQLEDLEFLQSLNPQPTTVRAAIDAVRNAKGKGWSRERASAALRLLKEVNASASVPVLPLQGERTRTTASPVPGELKRTSEEQEQGEGVRSE